MPAYKVGDRVITKVRKWTWGKSKEKQTPYVRVNFENYIDWTGFLSPKSIEHTMEALDVMGFKGIDLSQLIRDDALNTEIEVTATIDEIRDYNGKKYYKARWINKIGGFGFDGDDAAKDMVDYFKQFDTRAYIDNTIDTNKKTDSKIDDSYEYDIGTDFSSDDIPF